MTGVMRLKKPGERVPRAGADFSRLFQTILDFPFG